MTVITTLILTRHGEAHCNVARIVGTGLCVQYWDPDKALGFFHEFSGWVMFVVSLGCLYLVHRCMQLILPAKPSPAKAQIP